MWPLGGLMSTMVKALPINILKLNLVLLKRPNMAFEFFEVKNGAPKK
jgi:hypothetical protein